MSPSQEESRLQRYALLPAPGTSLWALQHDGDSLEVHLLPRESSLLGKETRALDDGEAERTLLPAFRAGDWSEKYSKILSEGLCSSNESQGHTSVPSLIGRQF